MKSLNGRAYAASCTQRRFATVQKFGRCQEDSGHSGGSGGRSIRLLGGEMRSFVMAITDERSASASFGIVG
jgi:hypothetical protein